MPLSFFILSDPVCPKSERFIPSLLTFLDLLCFFFFSSCWVTLLHARCVGGPVSSLPLLSSLSFRKTSNDFCLRKDTETTTRQFVWGFSCIQLKRQTVQIIVSMTLQIKKGHYEVANLAPKPAKPFRSYNAFGEDQTLFSCHEECYMVRWSLFKTASLPHPYPISSSSPLISNYPWAIGQQTDRERLTHLIHSPSAAFSCRNVTSPLLAHASSAFWVFDRGFKSNVATPNSSLIPWWESQGNSAADFCSAVHWTSERWVKLCLCKIQFTLQWWRVPHYNKMSFKLML